MEDVSGGSPGEITLIFDQAAVDLDALQRSAYAVAANMTVDIRLERDGLRVHPVRTPSRCRRSVEAPVSCGSK